MRFMINEKNRYAFFQRICSFRFVCQSPCLHGSSMQKNVSIKKKEAMGIRRIKKEASK